MLQHKHLIISAKVNNPPKDAEYIKKWLRGVISDIDMEILIGPEAIYYSVPGNSGVTAFAIITTSHLVLHTFDDDHPANFEFDVYSCKDFDINKVFSHVKEFGIVELSYKFLDRENNLEEIVL